MRITDMENKDKKMSGHDFVHREEDHKLGFDKPIFPNPRISESTYIEVLKGLLENMTKPEEEWSSAPNDLYMSVVHNEFVHVDVVDDESGEILYTAPPFRYNPPLTDYNYNGLIDWADKIKSKQRTKAIQGVRFHVGEHFSRTGVDPKDAKTWNEILDRYGLKYPGKENAENTDSPSEDANSAVQSTEDEW